MDPLVEQQYANMPSKLMGAMKEDKKPFTYTLGGVGEKGYLDLNQIKSSKMKRRIEANLKDDQILSSSEMSNYSEYSAPTDSFTPVSGASKEATPQPMMQSSSPAGFVPPPPPPPPPPPSTAMPYKPFTPAKVAAAANNGVTQQAHLTNPPPPPPPPQMPCHTTRSTNNLENNRSTPGRVVTIPIRMESMTAKPETSYSFVPEPQPRSSSSSYYDLLAREVDEMFKPFNQTYASMFERPSQVDHQSSFDRNNSAMSTSSIPARPNLPGVSPYSTQLYSSSPVSQSVDGLTHQVQQMFRPLPRTPLPPVRSYDPGSIQDQEQEIYDQEKMQEQIAIKTSPYRSRAVVSPKPKVKHDHVQGSYLAMQHYPDAPYHAMPLPMSYGRSLTPSISEQQRFQNYVQQVDPYAAEQGVKMPYNSPIGLYSRDNALDTLQKTSGREPNRERVVPVITDYLRDPVGVHPARPESPRQSASFKHLMNSMVHQGVMV